MSEDLQSATAITTAEYNKLKEKAEKYDIWAKTNRMGTWLKATDKLEAIKTHLESYPDERDDETYCITRHYPSTAGPRVFNSVLFLTHLETWHKQLKELLEAEPKRNPIWQVWYVNPDDGKEYYMMVQAPDGEAAKIRFKKTRWKGKVEPTRVTGG